MASPFRLQPSGRTRTALLDDAGRGVAAQTVANAFFDDAADPFSPADLWHTGQWIAPYSLGLWRGLYSAGPSRDVDLTEATNPPTVAAALNGYATAAFDGSTTRLLQGLPASSFFGASAGTIAVLFYGSNTGTYATPAGGYQEPSLVCSIGNWWALTHSASGCRAIIDDGTVKSVTATASLNAWHLAIMRWDGTTLGLSIDGGTEVTVACGAPGDLSDSFRVGTSYATAEFFNGRMGAIFMRPTKATTAESASLLAWVSSYFGLALGGITINMVGLPARARGGASTLSLGGLTVDSKGLRAGTRGGVSPIAASTLALAGVGLPPVRRGGVSALATSLALSARGLPASTRTGSSSLGLGGLSLAGLGLPTRTAGGSSAVALGGLTLVSKGLPTSSRGGVSVLSPGSLSFVGVGLPSATRGGVQTLALGVSTTALVSVGLPSTLRAGVSTITLGPVALTGQGLPAATRGGSSTSTPGALTVASKGLPARTTGGSSTLATSLALAARGLPTSPRGGASALALGPVAVAGVGLPAGSRGGVSVASPGPLTLASKGLPPQLRAGVAASLPVFVVAARGLPARARGGASTLSLGGTTLALVGLPADRSCGVGLLELGGRSLVSIGLPATTRGGVGLLSVRAANQAGTVALELVPRALVAISGAPRADVTLDLSPRALVALVTESPMSQPYRFDIGDDAVFTATFKLSETGELSDPTTLEVTVTPPTAAPFVVAYPAATLERKSLGVYRLSVDCNEVGVWRAHFRSTGPAKAGEPVSWTVR